MSLQEREREREGVQEREVWSEHEPVPQPFHACGPGCWPRPVSTETKGAPAFLSCADTRLWAQPRAQAEETNPGTTLCSRRWPRCPNDFTIQSPTWVQSTVSSASSAKATDVLVTTPPDHLLFSQTKGNRRSGNRQGCAVFA